MDINSEKVAYQIKRLIGNKINNDEITKYRKYLSYNITSDDNENILVKIGCELLTPEELSAMILRELKKNACEYLGEDITKAIITVPASFNDAQRQATKDAAKIAGLDCVRIIHEPTAAALAYGMLSKSKNNNINFIIYDFGGGTLDVSLLNISNGIFQVLGYFCNTYLCGFFLYNKLIV